MFSIETAENYVRRTYLANLPARGPRPTFSVCSKCKIRSRGHGFVVGPGLLSLVLRFGIFLLTGSGALLVAHHPRLHRLHLLVLLHLLLTPWMLHRAA